VGPEALHFICSHTNLNGSDPGHEPTPKHDPTTGKASSAVLHPVVLYTMVLNPEEITGSSGKLCGIPLRIPIRNQIREITRTLPCLKRFGLLYDPRYNASFFTEAHQEGKAANIHIIPLKVASKKEIPMVLQKHWHQIDSLWIIPDRTVISESIIQYIIKEAVLNRTPVIGYNRFFYDSGSALAFVFEYQEIGKQTAKLALKILTSRICQSEAPNFQTWINSRIIEKLNIKVQNSECREQGGE
jgi:putative ABC transport system substrate-binding protein